MFIYDDTTPDVLGDAEVYIVKGASVNWWIQNDEHFHNLRDSVQYKFIKTK